MASFCIGDRRVGSPGRPFVIAEIGVNHENDLQRAKTMVLEAARAGADAVKFQTYKAERLAAQDSPTYWNERRTQRQYFQGYDHFGPDEYRELSRYCREVGVVFLSTPFDAGAVDLLEPLVPAYKIASADITNLDLITRVSAKGKPVLLSTGASTVAEIARAVDTIMACGVTEVALLHCVLHYPTDFAEANLRSITYLRKAFPDCVIGYSDHCKPDPGMSLLTAAALLGADVLEKHFTDDKSLPGNDHYHAMDAADLALLRANLDLVAVALGEERKYVGEREQQARRYARRSVVAAVDIPAGTRIEPCHLTCKRPCTGIPAEHLQFVIGRVANRQIPADTILTWGMLD
jgi:N-acetylneuraminate synthase